MLRDGTRTEKTPLSRRDRMLLLGCLCFAGLGLSALRGPAQSPAEKGFVVPTLGPCQSRTSAFRSAKPKATRQRRQAITGVAAGAGKVTVQSRPPFAIARYLPDSAGIVAVRPAEVFSSPDMKESPPCGRMSCVKP